MKKIEYKFREGELIDDFARYIDSTYSGHYSRNKFQATEFVIDGGHGTGFCIGNVMKYAQRYGKKGSRSEWRKDIMKVLHYALIQLYIHDRMASEVSEVEEYRQMVNKELEGYIDFENEFLESKNEEKV